VPVHLQGPWSFLFGRLTLHAIPYDNVIILFAFTLAAVAGIAIVLPVLYFKKIPYLWRE
jgi:cytochrome o ubiquinol oxidase subunit I